MLGKYPGRTIHFAGVILLGIWITNKAMNSFWPIDNKANVQMVEDTRDSNNVLAK